MRPLIGLVFLCSSASTDQLARAGPIKGPFRSSFVVGDLSREEARTYFFNYILPFCKHTPSDASEAWERVYEVCGGNPGLLLKCIGEAAAFDSWELGARLCRTPLPCSCTEVCCACPQAATPSCKPQ